MHTNKYSLTRGPRGYISATIPLFPLLAFPLPLPITIKSKTDRRKRQRPTTAAARIYIGTTRRPNTTGYWLRSLAAHTCTYRHTGARHQFARVPMRAALYCSCARTNSFTVFSEERERERDRTVVESRTITARLFRIARVACRIGNDKCNYW